jgi:DNA-binding NtrC family response regulator
MPDTKNKVLKKPKVLIVDDDIQVLTMLKTLLAKAGVECTVCTCAQEALSILEITSSIKLCLLDISMPDITGIELLERIQKVIPSVQVIMITGLTDIQTAKKCMVLGAKDYITKPFDMEYLQTSVLAEIIPYL